MPPDLPNDQELMLKKRARRRLVGAVALVLLMVIILPQVLQDRALLAKQEPIRITMPAASTVAESTLPAPVEAQVAEPQHSTASASDVNNNSVVPPATEPVHEENTAAKSSKEAEANHPNAELSQSEKQTDLKTAEPAKAQPPVSSKSKASFTVQVGVYSDVDNVKRLQERLKQAGFSSQTEKIRTPKGDSLRLKAGNFSSRQDAVTAQAKIKAIGLSGIVVSNE